MPGYGWVALSGALALLLLSCSYAFHERHQPSGSNFFPCGFPDTSVSVAFWVVMCVTVHGFKGSNIGNPES